MRVIIFNISMFNLFFKYIDTPVNLFMVRYSGSSIETMAAKISAIAEVEILIVVSILIVIYFAFARKWREFFIIGLSICSTAVVVTLMKYFFMRVRPENALQIVVNDPSFPSGHASIAAAFFGALIVVFWSRISSPFGKNLFVFLSVFAVVSIGLSRLILNVHWASDVIVGWLIGAVLVFVSVLFSGFIKTKIRY